MSSGCAVAVLRVQRAFGVGCGLIVALRGVRGGGAGRWRGFGGWRGVPLWVVEVSGLVREIGLSKGALGTVVLETW